MEPPRLSASAGQSPRVWVVSYAGMEWIFVEDWRALELFDSILNRPTSPEFLLRDLRYMKAA